jgi:hypothetical protein
LCGLAFKRDTLRGLAFKRDTLRGLAFKRDTLRGLALNPAIFGDLGENLRIGFTVWFVYLTNGILGCLRDFIRRALRDFFRLVVRDFFRFEPNK